MKFNDYFAGDKAKATKQISEELFELDNNGLVDDASSDYDGQRIASGTTIRTTLCFSFPENANTGLALMKLDANGKNILFTAKPQSREKVNEFEGTYEGSGMKLVFMETGTIFKFHNDLDTDQIIASQYLLLPNLEEMKEHTFESLDPDFPKKVKPGDFVVGGENFGCGSSREQAPGVLKALGVQAVVAKSFARIFYRNAINIGLPVIVCKDLPDDVKTGDTMELSMSDGTAHANGKTYSCTKLPEYMQNILNQGGLIASLNREED